MRGGFAVVVCFAAVAMLLAPLTWAAPVSPLKIGQTYTYEFSMNGKPIGPFTVTCAQEAGAAMKVSSHMDMAAQGTKHVLDSTLVVAEDLRPRRYSVQGKRAKVEYTYTCVYGEDGKSVKRDGAMQGVRVSGTVQLPDGWEAFDNNEMAGWSLLGARLGVAPGVTKSVQCFHPMSGQILQCTFDFQAAEKLTVGGKTYDTVRCEIAEIKNTFWFTEDGLMIKGEQGPLAYTLKP